jgi:3-dehydroquinate dehydratase-1
MMMRDWVFGGTPKIVLSLNDAILPMKKKSPRLFDIVEMRVDLFSISDDALLSFADSLSCYPTIATIRSKCEGGDFRFSERKRFALFQKIIPHVSAVDIELSSKTILSDVIQSARNQKKIVMVSYHNFNKTPPRVELDRIFNQAKSAGADMVKVAAFANGDQDIQRLARFTIEHAGQNIVTIAMGEKGEISRLFFPALGSLFTYGYLGEPTAPGQMDCRELSRLMRRFYPR